MPNHHDTSYIWKSFISVGGLPAWGCRGLFLRAARVLLSPGAEQDGIAAPRLGHHELRQAFRTRVHGETVHLWMAHKGQWGTTWIIQVLEWTSPAPPEATSSAGPAAQNQHLTRRTARPSGMLAPHGLCSPLPAHSGRHHLPHTHTQHTRCSNEFQCRNK